METRKIDITRFRGPNSTLFVGRDTGNQARRELKLDILDNNDQVIQFEIAKDTTSIAPSFILGLFSKSIASLGVERFKKKYLFHFQNNDPKRKELLQKNLDAAINFASSQKGQGAKRFLDLIK